MLRASISAIGVISIIGYRQRASFFNDRTLRVAEPDIRYFYKN